jgi:hypothetical protein
VIPIAGLLRGAGAGQPAISWGAPLVSIVKTEFGKRFKAMPPGQVVSTILSIITKGDIWSAADALATAIQGFNLHICEKLGGILTSSGIHDVSFIDYNKTAIGWKTWMDGEPESVLLSRWTEPLKSHIDFGKAYSSRLLSEVNEALARPPQPQAEPETQGGDNKCRKGCCSSMSIFGHVTVVLSILGAIAIGITVGDEDREMALGLDLGLGLFIGLLFEVFGCWIGMNEVELTVHTSNRDLLILPESYYKVQSKVPGTINPILAEFARSIPRDKLESVKARYRTDGSRPSIVVAGFLIDYFARPATEILAQGLEWMSKTESAERVRFEQFESIFVLYRFTDKQGMTKVYFGPDFSEKLVEVLVNLIVNGTMEMHTALMHFARLTATNYNEDSSVWLTRHCGVCLYDTERAVLRNSLQTIYTNASPRIEILPSDMQAKLLNVKQGLDLMMVDSIKR